MTKSLTAIVPVTAEDPELNDLPIGHLLQWRAIQWLKLHRVRHYEVGVQFFGPQPHPPVPEKERKISFFKRGFGGRTVTSWRGEKFYDAAYARRVLEERARQFAEGLTHPAVWLFSLGLGVERLQTRRLLSAPELRWCNRLP